MELHLSCINPSNSNMILHTMFELQRLYSQEKSHSSPVSYGVSRVPISEKIDCVTCVGHSDVFHNHTLDQQTDFFLVLP